MILDHNRETNNMLKFLLEDEFTVFQAFCQEEARAVLKGIGKRLNAVLMENIYWEDDGELSVNLIREQVLKLRIPALSLMEQYDSYLAAKAIENGADEILVKACKKQIIKKRVENLILKGELTAAREYDSLTGIYNKEAFFSKVEELLKNNAQTRYWLLCLDIEHFKVINDLYGTEEGDRLLRFVGERLKILSMQIGGIAGRFASDIFAGCYPDGEERCEEISREIMAQLHGYPLQMEVIADLGFYYIKDTSIPVSTMCDRALIALKSIRGNYLDDYAIYHDSMRDELLLEQELINDMELALENREFKLYLQPQCNLATSKIVGAEALVRWQHPEKGLILPGKFIPLFEENHFILKLDNYIWEECCKFLRDWVNGGNVPVPISVNLSRIHLCDSGLYDRLIFLIEKYDISPAWIDLEIMESAYADDTGYLNQIVDRLRNYGFTILLDDFGRGYSSLSTLKDINADALKLDMRFLTEASNNKDKGRDILECVVYMAKRLHMPALVEGVETKEQVDFLRKINCCYAQGFYYYRPMAAQAFQQLLKNKDLVEYDSYISKKLDRTM